VSFKPVQAKAVRITLGDPGENAPNWSISNLRIYEPGR
jgi:hypothetical protein